MKSDTMYPCLARYFKNMSELAKAGCMSRPKAWKILSGNQEFTEEEKKAIASNIVLMAITDKKFKKEDVDLAIQAWSGRFDEIYRKKA